jgi:hypothetical protein
MASESETGTFDRETLLDLVVNAIPLGMLLFFIVVFLVINPFGSSPVNTAIQISLLIVPFVALAFLTYISGKAVSDAEDELEEEGLELSEEAGAEGDESTESVPEDTDAES